MTKKRIFSDTQSKWIMILASLFSLSFPLWEAITLEGLNLTFLFATILFIWYDWCYEET